MSSLYHFSPTETQAVWQQLCAELETKLTPAVFGTWILSNPLNEVIIDGDNATARFVCLTAFHASTIKRTLHDQIKSSLDALLGKQTALDFQVGSQPTSATPPLSVSPATSPAASTAAVASATAPTPPSQPATTETLSPHQNFPHRLSSPTPPPAPTQHHQPPTQTTNGYSTPTLAATVRRAGQSISPRVEDLFSPTTIQSVTMDRALTTARQVGLRPDYTFETFAVSTTNEMAHAAATAVSNRPGVAYNPLFLYGGVGVGKTHLMHAIGNNIIKNNPDTRIIYCTGEEFTNDIVSAIQMKKAIKFKEKYRTAQVLLLDDVQFLAGKNAVQEEFFHTFNALIKQASQIVMTSDRSPHEINLLEDRLRSRFEAGLMIDIQQPSFELRTAILLIKANASNITIPMDLAQLIASRVDSARKIEGMITSIKSAVELRRQPITQELIEHILHTETDQTRPTLKVSPNEVLRAVANHYHVKQNAIKGQQRVADLVKARHVAMYLLKEDLHLSLTEIGKWFSNRDHTSALHAIKKISASISTDEILQRDISALRMSLTAVSK